MANKNKNKKNNKKNGNNRLSIRATQTVTVPALSVKLPYPYFGLMTEAAAGSGASQSFAINNVFDPDFSGVGAQPLGFDQFAQFYGRYRVTRIMIEASFANSSTSPIVVGMYASAQSTLPANPLAWTVQPRSVKAVQLGGSSSGPSVAVLRASWNLWDVFGVTKSEYMDEMDFAATFSGGPARQAYLHCFIVGGGVAVQTSRLFARLYYSVEMSQPVALGLS